MFCTAPLNVLYSPPKGVIEPFETLEKNKENNKKFETFPHCWRFQS